MDRTALPQRYMTPPAAVQRGDSVAVVSAVPASSTPSVYVSSYGGLAPRGSVSATPALPVLPISSDPQSSRLLGGRRRATEGGFLDNRVVGGGPEDGWVGLTLNA